MPPAHGVVVGKGNGRKEDYEMVKRTLPGMSIPEWGSRQSQYIKGKIVGIVQITHSVKIEECTPSPWAQGPICNIIARTAWLPTWVVSNGGQGVHPIKGGDAVVEQVRSQANAARVCETQGCWLHPETDEMAQRTQRKKRSTSITKIMKGVGESGRQEQGGTSTGARAAGRG